MYKQNAMAKTSLKINDTAIGETIEQKIERITTNQEGIIAETPVIYTDRKDGVKSELDIRTDKWELATGITDIQSRNRELKRNERLDKEAKAALKAEADKNSPKTRSADTTNEK